MPVNIVIVGLGQIGASFGLALGEKKDLVLRTGHDQDVKTARQAEKLGAVDRIEKNLPKAVRDADLTLVCLPLDQIRQTLEIIGPVLKEGAVVMDTGMAKEAAAAWAKELLPAGRFYVGLTPVINPDYLHGTDFGIEGARSDLFKKGLIGIVSPPQTDSGAIKLAADLTRLVGADPLFADPVEIDGLMSATHLLPQLLAAAMLNATIDQPGWREAQKLAGRAFAEASEPVLESSEAPPLAKAAILNRENMLRLIDSLAAGLQLIRGDIDAEDEISLTTRLERARQGRLKWWADRKSGNLMLETMSDVELPENPGVMDRLFGIRKRPKIK